MGNADQNTFATLTGVTQDGNGNPTNTGLAWRPVRVRGRQIISGLVKTAWGALTPFATPNPASPTTTSLIDYTEGIAEQTASRFIDPAGNVVNFFTTWVVDWLWKLDGAPTPLTSAKLAEYLQLANQLNPWPQGFAGMNFTQFPTEPQASYPAFPPAAGTNLDLSTFLPSATHPNGSNTAGSL
jgi:hypothetical protein